MKPLHRDPVVHFHTVEGNGVLDNNCIIAGPAIRKQEIIVFDRVCLVLEQCMIVVYSMREVFLALLETANNARAIEFGPAAEDYEFKEF